MELTVNTSKRYTIRIERGALDQLGAYCASLFAPGKKAVVITDTHVAPLYLERVSTSLRNAGFDVTSCAFPAGEPSKRLSTIEGIYGHMAQAHITRSDFAVALGGGVTGDMAGFAAASYLRGIPFVQVPTTLLSQVDSSVGGKTGVDLPQGKNLVGAFWQPSFVLIDPDTLNTLSPHFFADGMGEVIKYGCIKSDRPGHAQHPIAALFRGRHGGGHQIRLHQKPRALRPTNRNRGHHLHHGGRHLPLCGHQARRGGAR